MMLATAPKKRDRKRSRSDMQRCALRSIERERDDVVATAEVDLGVSTRADHDVLLAVDRIARRRGVDTGSGAEAPEFLAVRRVIGCELAVAFTREHQSARGGQNAADHRLRRLDLPLELAG